MKKFKDNNNSEWEIAINVAAVRKVRNILNADLLDIQTTMPRLLADPIFLVDVIYVLCQSQANECNISDEQFGSAMAGDALGAAKWAVDSLFCDRSAACADGRSQKAMERSLYFFNPGSGLLTSDFSHFF